MTREALARGDASPDFANLLGFLLQGPARPLMGKDALFPAFLITKTRRGTGATKAIQACQMILMGDTDVRAWSSKPDVELEKEVFAALMGAKTMLFWDNVEKVGGTVMATLLTSATFTARVLGQSKDRTVPNRAAVSFTGNNPVFDTDLRRRLFICRMVAKVENPHLRPLGAFKIPDLENYVREHRARLYRSLLILIQNWIAKGRPEYTGPVLASYVPWSKTIGGILQAAGIKGFLGNRDRVEAITSGASEDDPHRDLVEHWWDAVRRKVSDISLEDMIGKRQDMYDGLIGLCRLEKITLPVKLRRDSEDAFDYDPKSFGDWIARGADRTFELQTGLQDDNGEVVESKIVKVVLQRGKKVKNVQHWSLVVAGPETGA